MSIYTKLNRLTEYVEENLEGEIDYRKMAGILGTNVATMQRVFRLIAGMSLTEYIRRRRLSQAGYDLCEAKMKVMDVAIKYQYENATAFARVFRKFHGVRPSLAKKGTKLRNFPRMVWDEREMGEREIDYEIVELGRLELWGEGMATCNQTIQKDAPKFFQEMSEKWDKEMGEVEYGMVTYGEERMNCAKYYCLWKKEKAGFEKVVIPEGRWLKFRVGSQDEREIQEMSQRFYGEFWQSCRCRVSDLPELECYHDGVTDFLVPIC